MIRIATRQSPLALIQTRQVQAILQGLNPSIKINLVPLSTKGDQIQDRSLADIGGKGLFIKALEEALLKNEADFAVHSLKDMPPVLDPEFVIAAVLPRLSACDVLVSRQGKLSELPKGAVVGTSSVRRRAELLHYRPDLNTVMIRGNVQTRLGKLEEGFCDAIILAEAGLMRLGLTHHITEVLSTELFLPSVGQGILAIESLRNRPEMIDLLAPLNDANTYACMNAERTLNAGLGANCTSPVGSFAQIEKGMLKLQGAVLSQDGKIKLSTEVEGPIASSESLGKQAAMNLLAQGAREIL